RVTIGFMNRDSPDERRPCRPGPRPDLLNAYWTRAECPYPGDRWERSGCPAGSMPDRTPRWTSHAPIRDFAPHLMAHHPRPPPLHVTPTRPERTLITGPAPRAADRSAPGSPRTAPEAPPPPPAGPSRPWRGGRPWSRS